jgi:hypothetical protein
MSFQISLSEEATAEITLFEHIIAFVALYFVLEHLFVTSIRALH